MAKTSTGGYCGAVSTLVRMGFVHCVLVLIVVFDLKNAWGSFRYNQSPRSMKPQSDPVSRGPLSSRGFWNPLQKASPFQSHDSRGFAQESLGLQEKQVLQGPVKPLVWRFPIVPEVQREVAEDFQLRHPVTPSSVAVQCGENRVHVEVQQDLFSNGQLIQPSGLSLGGCPVVGWVPGSSVLFFENDLHNCNSVLMVGTAKYYWIVFFTLLKIKLFFGINGTLTVPFFMVENCS